MPSHDQNLAAVRAACVAASGKNTTEGCICSPIVVCASHAALERFDPTLPDVLLALGKNDVEFDLCGHPEAEGTIAASCLKQPYGEDFYFRWNLRLPLSGQSEDTVRYIASLLDYHHDTARA